MIPYVFRRARRRSILCGIRLRPDAFNATVIPKTLSLASEAKSDFRVSLCLNPIYSGTVTWNGQGRTVQHSENNGNTVSDYGNVLFQSFVSGDTNTLNINLDSSLRIGKSLNGNFDELWVVVESLTANDKYYCSLNYLEAL